MDDRLPAGCLALRLCSLGTLCNPPLPHSHLGRVSCCLWCHLELQQGNPSKLQSSGMLVEGSTALSMGDPWGVGCRCSGVRHPCLELLACFPGSRDAPVGHKGLPTTHC